MLILDRRATNLQWIENRMVSVKPEKRFYNVVDTVLDDQDRFEDMSHLIFKRNEILFKRFLRDQSDQPGTVHNEMKNFDTNEKPVTSTVCTIIWQQKFTF